MISRANRNRRLVALTAMGVAVAIVVSHNPGQVPAGTARTPRCAGNQLRARLGPSGVGLGHVGVSAYLKNVSSSRCLLYGYATLQMLGRAGRPIPTITERPPGYTVPLIKPRPVVLTSGASATFYAGYDDATGYGDEHCPLSTRVAITLPDDSTPITIRWRLSPYGGSTQRVHCGGVYVSAVMAGIHRRP